MEYPGSSQMIVQVYPFHSQTERGRKAFLGATIYLSSELSLTYAGIANYYKSFHYPLSTLSVVIGNTLTVFKTNQ